MPGEITPEEDKKAPWIHPKKKKAYRKERGFYGKERNIPVKHREAKAVPGDKDKANFNEDYMIMKLLRKTDECRYYLLKEKSGNKKKVSLKMWREDWLVDNWEGIKMIDNEVLLMRELNHPNIIEMLDFDN